MGEERGHTKSPKELSLDAALQLEALVQGKRNDAPKFDYLIQLLKEPRVTRSGRSTVSMLTDVRSAPLLQKAIPQGSLERPELVVQFFETLLRGVAGKDPKQIRLAKRFCLALNELLLTKEYDTLVERQPRFKHHPRAGDVR